ncbi:cobalamin biosynthesis protein CobG [Streptomyces sp. NPDC004539]|uniref:cobalamin biosynthesis protein CobG n=1 Tax=Streptomyces sp. NPDC004539 TaxID=3154280 RepID=UPI0033A99CF9
MLTAVPTPPARPSSQATALSRGRDDACPGALRLHAADDGALARVRIPGGVLRTGQARALGLAARELGDGELHLTSRGNVQLRGLTPDGGAELAERLEVAGLLPSWRHERVRNVVASPLSGLDGRSLLDVRPWLRELDALLCASGPAARLSGRFLFALDDGRGDVAALGADVSVLAAPDGGAWVRVGASPDAVRVPAGDAARAAVRAAEAFVEVSGGRVWRVSELPCGGKELVSYLGEPARPVWPRSAEPAPGTVTAPDGTTSLSVLAPLGRLTAARWDALTDASSDELRLTPWRGMVLPAVPAGRLAGLDAMGLVTGPDSPWLGVGSCVGRPGCAKAHADVRTDAAACLTGGGGLPVHWSGCERRCGRPRGDHVDVLAVPGGGYRISGAPSSLSTLAADVAAARHA